MVMLEKIKVKKNLVFNSSQEKMHQYVKECETGGLSLKLETRS